MTQTKCLKTQHMLYCVSVECITFLGIFKGWLPWESCVSLILSLWVYNCSPAPLYRFDINIQEMLSNSLCLLNSCEHLLVFSDFRQIHLCQFVQIHYWRLSLWCFLSKNFETGLGGFLRIFGWVLDPARKELNYLIGIEGTMFYPNTFKTCVYS